MELKTKYQYTNFIYPYIIKENRYDKYLLKLIKNPNCKLKIFEKQKDLEIYTYFLPTIRQYMFPIIEFSKPKIQKLEQLEPNMKSVILSKYPCIIFEYTLQKDIQGKTEQDGIFFKIQSIQIICFSTGICFLNIKTNIEDSKNFNDILNFNYKFREINSEFIGLKEYENIKIQTDTFSDIIKLSELIDELTAPNINSKNLNLDTDRFLTYSYTCIDGQNWDNENKFSNIENDFLKYAYILPSSHKTNFSKENVKQTMKIVSQSKYIKCAFTKLGSTLLTSGLEPENYTKLPLAYENEYLYTYILALYQKIYLKKLSLEFKQNYKTDKTRKKFIKFTKELWIQEITNDDTGTLLYNSWKEVLELEELYSEVKNKYDIIYKEWNIEKNTKITILIAVMLFISLIFNIMNLLM